MKAIPHLAESTVTYSVKHQKVIDGRLFNMSPPTQDNIFPAQKEALKILAEVYRYLSDEHREKLESAFRIVDAMEYADDRNKRENDLGEMLGTVRRTWKAYADIFPQEIPSAKSSSYPPATPALPGVA